VLLAHDGLEWRADSAMTTELRLEPTAGLRGLVTSIKRAECMLGVRTGRLVLIAVGFPGSEDAVDGLRPRIETLDDLTIRGSSIDTSSSSSSFMSSSSVAFSPSTISPRASEASVACVSDSVVVAGTGVAISAESGSSAGGSCTACTSFDSSGWDLMAGTKRARATAGTEFERFRATCGRDMLSASVSGIALIGNIIILFGRTGALSSSVSISSVSSSLSGARPGISISATSFGPSGKGMPAATM